MPGARRIAVLIMLVLGAGVLPAWSFLPATGAPDDKAFTALRGFEPTGAKVRVEPRSYAATRVDLAALRAELPGATGSAVVSVPDPSGALQRFRVQRTSLMESQLAAAHPEITTYAGRGVEQPSTSIALDVTPMGFHASVRGPGGTRAWFVDPAYNQRGTSAHLSYFGAALPAAEQRRREGEIESVGDRLAGARDASRTPRGGDRVTRRTYRLALTSDPGYAEYFGTANVLAEKVTLMNRVNQVYNDDLAIELRLVNATEALNFDTEEEALDPDGPCGAAPCFSTYDAGNPADPLDDIPGGLDYCDSTALGENRNVLGLLVGASNYDIGHLALGVDGGGVAFLGVVGGDYKASGCTGLSDPKGDFFAIDYVAHEMGHQFAGNHTFNGTQSNCRGGNREDTTAVEPGSGSSVMAYAGICRQDNLQDHSDPYFSQRSVDEITSYTSQAPYANIEVQTVTLRGFDGNDTITIGYRGGTPVTVTRGVDYNAAGVEAAVEQVTGANVSIAQWDFDEFGYRFQVTGPDDNGFQVIFNSAPTVLGADGSDIDYDMLTVTSSTPGVSAMVGEVAKGGPATNGGFDQAADNHAPRVLAPEPRTLPVRTPFALTGSGTDPDGNPLVFLWEQNDDARGRPGTALVDNTKVHGPLFRVFGKEAFVSDEDSLKINSPGQNLADGSSTRVFPDMDQVLRGNTNAATGVCPPAPAPTTPYTRLDPALVECYSEFLPNPEYLGTPGLDGPAMHFRLTARDLFPTGGGLTYDDVTLRLDPQAGPFLVTSQATPGTTVSGGESVPVTWAVNNTQALAPMVRITASTDAGRTWDTVLAAATPNDGSETVQMPNLTANEVRIRIEAVGNYFFDVNDAAFKLVASPAPETTITTGPADGSVVLDKTQTFTYSSSVPGSTFTCQIDEDTVPCPPSGKTVRFLADTHLFSIAAVGPTGLVDPTPATRTFTVPRDNGQLVRKGTWQRRRTEQAYAGDYLVSRDKGAKLITRIRNATSVALVVRTTRRSGTVKVLVGQRRVGTIDLGGAGAFGQLRTITFDKARSGKLKLVVGQRKPVSIEGVAVVTNVS